MDGKIAKWWMPDDVAFVDDIPQRLIRARLTGYVLPTVAIGASAKS
jgi:fatty-acyl-CoA synthase